SEFIPAPDIHSTQLFSAFFFVFYFLFFFFFQAEDGIRDGHVTGVQTCALPISFAKRRPHFTAISCFTKDVLPTTRSRALTRSRRSEEHTSELQSRGHIVCRLLLEKKNPGRYPSPA